MEVMNIEEVARYLKLKPQTIYVWAQQGKIPAAKIGKEWRFRKDVIDEWFNQHLDEKFLPLLQSLEKKKKN
jgi:excisionase family DNA binding protein